MRELWPFLLYGFILGYRTFCVDTKGDGTSI